MNKREKEVIQAELDREKAVLNELKKNYKEALEDINAKLEYMMARQDADMQHVIYRIEHQKALKTQVQSILENLQTNEFESISAYLAKSYEDGFIGSMYDMHGQGVKLVVPIDQKQVADAIQHETKLSEPLYTSLGKDIKDLQKKISGEISRGISTGQSFPEISRNIAAYADLPLNRAMVIARTEAHRIQNKAKLDAQFKAKAKGADVVKQWIAVLDAKTRDSHRILHSQIRELDERFEVNGHKAMYPGGFSIAEEDINCRCEIGQRARLLLSDAEKAYLNSAAEEAGLDEAESFKDYRKKYMKALEKGVESSRITDEDKKAIHDYMSAKSYVVNEKFRAGAALTKEEQTFVDKLDKALDKMPTYHGTLRRSLYFYALAEAVKFVESHRVGEKVTYDEYLSTTMGEEYNSDGQVQMYIQDAKNGKDISSLNAGEAEVLYKRGSSFNVVNVVEQDGKYYILLEEDDE